MSLFAVSLFAWYALNQVRQFAVKQIANPLKLRPAYHFPPAQLLQGRLIDKALTPYPA
jgi:hypothetical protein